MIRAARTVHERPSFVVTDTGRLRCYSVPLEAYLTVHDRHDRILRAIKGDSYLLTGHSHCESPAGFDGTLQASESSAH
jgi:hypothetical protein